MEKARLNFDEFPLDFLMEFIGDNKLTVWDDRIDHRFVTIWGAFFVDVRWSETCNWVQMDFSPCDRSIVSLGESCKTFTEDYIPKLREEMRQYDIYIDPNIRTDESMLLKDVIIFFYHNN